MLAAGQSRRMGQANKLLAPIDGRAMVAHAVDAMLASRAAPVIVVTGHEADEVRAALGERPVVWAHNPDYAAGLSTSLAVGLAALPEDVEGVRDRARRHAADHRRADRPADRRVQPARRPRHLRADGARQARQPGAVRDPLRARRCAQIGGDVGARHLIGEHAEEVVEIEMDDDARAARHRHAGGAGRAGRDRRMSFDARAVRAEFPVFDHRPTGFHYLDSAATGQICRAAAEALLTFETRNRANVKRGIYPLAEAATEAFDDARRAIADYLGVADPDEVILTSGTTLGINLFAHAFGARLREGDEIVLSRARAPQQHRALAAAARAHRRAAQGPAGDRRGPARSRPARARS